MTEQDTAPALGTEELWNANQVAAVLGVSATEVGRRLKRQAPPLPRYHAGANAAALWLPEDVRLYALHSGRALTEHGGHRRLPVPMWLDIPELKAPLPRVADRVVTLPLRLAHTLGGPHPVHVRIWRGPVGDGERIVVLLAGVDGGTVHPTVAALGRIMAHEIVDAGLLSEDDAQRALWFGLGVRNPYVHGDPQALMYLSFGLADRPGGLLRRWRAADGADTRRLFADASAVPARLAHLSRLTGEDVELYPDGTHTPETVARYTAGERPVVLDWDPKDLAGTVRRTAVLRHWATALEQAGRPRDAATVTDAATTLADLAARIDLQYGSAYDGEDRSIVDRRVARITEEERDRLLGYAREFGGTNLGHWLRLHRAAATLAATAQGTDEQREALTAAMAFNAEVLVGIVRHYTTDRGGWPLRLAADDHQPAFAAYLKTLAWYGPKEEDLERAQHLRDALWDDEREGIQIAYDPYGRLVLVTGDRTALAVTCPADQAAALDLGIPHRGFLPLKDGRVQLWPLWGDVRCASCGTSAPEAPTGLPDPDTYRCTACGGVPPHPGLDCQSD